MLSMVDIFAGAGGLSEGFIRAGFEPIAHVEMDEAACYTLKTRMAYHWFKKQKRIDDYYGYLRQEISRTELYGMVPDSVLKSIIHSEITPKTLDAIFKQIDGLLNGHKLDLIIGGPPCQAYSLVGRSRDKNRMKGDRRNFLFTQYAEFLNRYSPKYFVFENVVGLLSAKNEDNAKYFDEILRIFSELRYSVEYRIINASKYGVPQNRKRVILVGRKGKHKGFYPVPIDAELRKFCVNDLFTDMPKIQAGQGSIYWDGLHAYNNKEKLVQIGIISAGQLPPLTFHIARPHQKYDLDIYKRVVVSWNKYAIRTDYNDLPNKLKKHNNRHSFTDRFKVVAGNIPTSHTVVAHISKDGHYYIHPDIGQNRSLTPREVARLQTFPDDYFFESVFEKPGRTAAYKQIGNAVPVLLAQRIAEQLLENW